MNADHFGLRVTTIEKTSQVFSRFPQVERAVLYSSRAKGTFKPGSDIDLREGFPPLCPDLVVELASPADPPQALRRKMAAYMANGAYLGWLLLPQSRTVEVWKAGGPETATSPLVLSQPNRLEAGPEFPGLVIGPRRIWEV